MVYLNNAATSHPKPECVPAAVQRHLQQTPWAAHRGGDLRGDFMEHARARLAAFLGAPGPDTLFFTSGATESLNILLHGLDLAGGHVVSTVTEHTSVLRPLHHLADDTGLSFTLVPCNAAGHIDPDDLRRAIRPQTAAVVLSHGSNVTGAVQDVPAIAHITREREIPLVLDAAQTAGHVPIHAAEWGVDAIAFTGHKGLLGLPGSGGFYLRRGLELRPWKTGGTGVLSDMLHQPQERPLAYEAGTPNTPGIAALATAVDWLERFDYAHLNTLALQRCGRLREALEAMPRVRLFGPANARLPILSLSMDDMTPNDLCYLLQESFDVVTRGGLHCAPLIHPCIGSAPHGTLRLSLSVLTNDVDISACIEAFLTITEGRPA